MTEIEMWNRRLFSKRFWRFSLTFFTSNNVVLTFDADACFLLFVPTHKSPPEGKRKWTEAFDNLSIYQTILIQRQHFKSWSQRLWHHHHGQDFHNKDFFSLLSVLSLIIALTCHSVTRSLLLLNFVQIGFIKFVKWIGQNWYMDFSKLLHGFAKAAACFF